MNSRTDEATRFFAVALSAVKIGDSAVAPRFELVAQPNDWNKSFKHQAQAEGMPEKSGTNFEYWSQFLGTLALERPGWTNSKSPSSRNWMNLRTGTSSLNYSLGFPVSGQPSLRAELYISDSITPSKNKARFDYLLDRKDEIEAQFGQPLSWEELPKASASRVAFYLPNASIDETARWSEYNEWFIKTTDRLKDTFGQYIPELSKI